MNKPNQNQLDALHRWAKANGRTWKNELRLAWSSGRYGYLREIDDSAYLQQLRNQFGPSWLTKFKLNA